MATKYRQISLKDTFSNYQDTFFDDVPSFFQLLNKHFDIQAFIPSVFRNAFYQRLGRHRLYPLTGFLSALILQKIFPFLLTLCSSFFLNSLRNFGIYADSLKLSMLLFLPDSSRNLNHATSKADVFLAGIASQPTVIVAHRMNCPEYIRSLKPLVA